MLQILRSKSQTTSSTNSTLADSSSLNDTNTLNSSSTKSAAGTSNPSRSLGTRASFSDASPSGAHSDRVPERKSPRLCQVSVSSNSNGKSHRQSSRKSCDEQERTRAQQSRESRSSVREQSPSGRPHDMRSSGRSRGSDGVHSSGRSAVVHSSGGSHGEDTAVSRNVLSRLPKKHFTNILTQYFDAYGMMTLRQVGKLWKAEIDSPNVWSSLFQVRFYACNFFNL